MLPIITKFFLDNESSIIVSLIVGTVFFILGPLGLWFSGKKVKREKVNKAISELLDLFESMLVNKENITISKLLTLFRAVERQNTVNLRMDSDLESILEDLSLRFAKSKHLSSDQKDVYQQQIDVLITDLYMPEHEHKDDTQEQRVLPKSIKSIMISLREEIKDSGSEKLNLLIDQMEKQVLVDSEPVGVSPIQLIIRKIGKRPKLFIWILIIYFIIVATFIYLIKKG